MRRLKAIALLLALIFACFYVAGCNTFHGFGKDVSSLGDSIQDASE